jgi:hypothetical protein
MDADGTRGDANDPTEPIDLSGLYADRPVPDDLEDRVVDGLVGAGLLVGRSGDAGSPGVHFTAQRPPARRSTPAGAMWPTLLRVAAGLALLGGGWLLGRSAGEGAAPGPPGAPETAPDHMLLLWEDPASPPAGDPSAVAAEYAAWAGMVASGGTPISGDELGSPRTLLPPDGREPTPPADATAGLRLGGYFLVATGSSDAAEALARDHPHRVNGGWVEVVPLVGR